MAITHKYLAQYKRMAARSLHPQAWHDFMRTPEAEAVGFALMGKEYGDTNADIVRAAKAYSSSQQDK